MQETERAARAISRAVKRRSEAAAGAAEYCAGLLSSFPTRLRCSFRLGPSLNGEEEDIDRLMYGSAAEGMLLSVLLP